MPDPEILNRLQRLEKKIDTILRQEKKANAMPVWMTEEEAAKSLRWTVRYLHRQAKSGLIPIRYRDTRGRNFMYNQQDVLDFLNK